MMIIDGNVERSVARKDDQGTRAGNLTTLKLR